VYSEFALLKENSIMAQWNAIAAYLVAHPLEAAGFITTLAGIWLTTRRSMLCWPFIFAANLFYLVVLFRAFLLSSALLQFAYMAFTIYGCWHWARGKRETGEVYIVPLHRQAMLTGLGVGAVGAVLLGFLMAHASASLPFLDASLASFSLLATWWQVRKHLANWWLWIAVDLAYIGEYLFKGLKLTALLYALLIVLALLGLRSWGRAPRAEA
jgi:nicotinamide mononucleotide transporter